MGFFKEVDILWNEGKTPAEIAAILDVNVVELMCCLVAGHYLKGIEAENISEKRLWGSKRVYQDKNGRIFRIDGTMPGDKRGN